MSIVLTEQFCHLVGRWNNFRAVWMRSECVIEGSHLAWLEHQPLGLLIWNSTRDCLPVTHVMNLHELGGAGQIIEKFSDTLQHMCWQHPFLSAPGGTRVTPRKQHAEPWSAQSVCTSCAHWLLTLVLSSDLSKIYILMMFWGRPLSSFIALLNINSNKCGRTSWGILNMKFIDLWWLLLADFFYTQAW